MMSKIFFQRRYFIDCFCDFLNDFLTLFKYNEFRAKVKEEIFCEIIV